MKDHYFIVVQSQFPLSKTLIGNLNSMTLHYVSEKRLNCMGRMMKRDLLYKKGVKVLKVSQHTLRTILNHKADLDSGNFDEDFSNAFRSTYTLMLMEAWIDLLNKGQDLDFSRINSGIYFSSSDVMNRMRKSGRSI